MRNLWKASTRTIGSHPCIELKTLYKGTEHVEYALAGPRGEIWEFSDGRYMALIVRDSRSRRTSQEQLVRFGADDLNHWVIKLGIPEHPSDQTPFANFFLH